MWRWLKWFCRLRFEYDKRYICMWTRSWFFVSRQIQSWFSFYPESSLSISFPFRKNPFFLPSLFSKNLNYFGCRIEFFNQQNQRKRQKSNQQKQKSYENRISGSKKNLYFPRFHFILIHLLKFILNPNQFAIFNNKYCHIVLSRLTRLILYRITV